MRNSPVNEKARNRPVRITRRRLIKLGSLSAALATLKPECVRAATLLGFGQPSNTVSPIMQQLSAYMSAASARALPEEVVEKAKQHILDTFAAMVSGSLLPAGRAALQYARAGGTGGEETIVASKLTSGPVEAAFVNAMLAQSDETDDSNEFS